MVRSAGIYGSGPIYIYMYIYIYMDHFHVYCVSLPVTNMLHIASKGTMLYIYMYQPNITNVNLL